MITGSTCEILRARGWSNVLIDLGEIRALDGRPGGGPWTVGLESPGGLENPGHHLATLDSADSRLSVEISVEQGEGYGAAKDYEDLPVGKQGRREC